MSFDGTKSHAAATKPTKEKTDWQVFLSQWVGMLAVVALCLLAWQLERIRTSVEHHDQVIDLQMRMNTTSNLVTERALAHFEERQAALSAQKLKLRAEPVDSTQPDDADSHSHRQSPTQQQPLFPLPE